MTRPAVARVTTYRAGPYAVAELRHRAGYAIVDTRTGRAAYVRPSPTSGRPIMAALPTLYAALRTLRALFTD